MEITDMKKIYISPVTELYAIASEGILKELSTTDVDSTNNNDPNKGNNGPGVEDDDNGPAAKRFDLDWDFEDLTSDWDLNE